jgi:hypothetical protein
VIDDANSFARRSTGANPDSAARSRRLHLRRLSGGANGGASFVKRNELDMKVQRWRRSRPLLDEAVFDGVVMPGSASATRAPAALSGRRHADRGARRRREIAHALLQFKGVSPSISGIARCALDDLVLVILTAAGSTAVSGARAVCSPGADVCREGAPERFEIRRFAAQGQPQGSPFCLGKGPHPSVDPLAVPTSTGPTIGKMKLRALQLEPRRAHEDQARAGAYSAR